MIAYRVLGVPDCLDAFRELPVTVQNSGMRKGLNAAGGVVRDAAVANSSKETGLHRKSLKVKVKIPNASYNRAHHGRPAYAVVGASRRVVQAVVQTSKGFRTKGAKGIAKAQAAGRTVRIRKPSRYSHLVERDTRFLSRAVATHGTSAKQKMIQKLIDHMRAWATSRRPRMAA